VISGQAGVGAYLLLRHDEAGCSDALDEVLRYFVQATTEVHGTPRWHTPAEWLTPEWRESYPHGCLNCGLAHGIPGPLVLLSLAVLQGIHVQGLRAAVDRSADWLCRHRADDAWGINWPYAVSLTSSGSDDPELSDRCGGRDGPSRAAWCYGSPGVARALWLAGEALDDETYRATAVAALDAVLDRPRAPRQIPSPTFCHGVAGLAQIALRFAHDTELPHIAEGARGLVDQLIDAYRPDSALGYVSLESDDREVDNPGLLDGAPGVALVLLAASTNVEPAWDRSFLLS
jgi:hypothetical protein